MTIQSSLTSFFVSFGEAMYKGHLEDYDKYQEQSDSGELQPRFFQLKDLQSMREGPSAIFESIVLNFYPFVCGRREYKRRCRCESISKIASTSDEAMILLVLENNFAYWSQIARAVHAGEDVGKRKMISWPIQPKWTHTRNNNNMEWTREGRLRFIEIQKLVSGERKSEAGRMMEEHMMEMLRSETTCQRKVKRKRDDEEDSVTMPVYDDDDNIVEWEI
jgi:hypothetical protein